MTGQVDEQAKKHFFISRSGEDAGWAQWIAWQLEAAGYSVIVQDWDFTPGSNFAADMRRALDSAETTIALYSPAYFRSSFTEDEWTAAIVQHGDEIVRFLPVRVAEVDVPKLLQPIVYVDLVGLDEKAARARVLDAAKRRRRTKPLQEPRFPGTGAPQFPSRAGTQPDAGQVLAVNAVPVEPSRFGDRLAESQLLRSFLHHPGVRLVTIVGRVGVGKSALASHVLSAEQKGAEPYDDDGRGGQRLDGIVYLNSRTTGLSLERLYTDLRRLLDDEAARQLSEYWSRLDATVRDNVDVLLDSLRERRLIILLDGLDSSLQDGVITVDGLRTFVEACLDRSDAPRLVVTSRVDMTVSPEEFPVVRSVKITRGLPTPDAVTLLRDLDPQEELGLANATEDDLIRAVELAGGIPRALELLAGILQADPTSSLSGLLGDERTLGTQVVEGLVAEAYCRLGSDEQRVLETMAAFDAPVTEAAIRFVVHTWFPGIDVRAALRRLVASYFTTATRGRGEYLLQTADRSHAYEQISRIRQNGGTVGASVPEYNRAAVESRVADYYGSVRLPPSEWRSIESVAPQIAEFEHRIRAREVDRALEVLQTIDRDYLFLWGHYTRLIELRQTVLDLPARPELRAANLASLGLATQVLGQYDAAATYYEEAVEAVAQAHDPDLQAQYIGDLGRLYRNLGDMDKALSCSQQALASAAGRGDREAVGRWQDRLGLVYAALGRLDEARALHEQAISTAREFGDHRSEGAALSNLGVVLDLMGLVADADRAQRDALVQSHAVNDRRGDAIILGRLGMLAESKGEFTQALALHEQALAIAQQLGERREQSYQLLGMGKARFGLGAFTEAERDLRAARDLDVPETSYQAALALSLLLAAQEHEDGCASFADTIQRCEERLRRSAGLFAARYALATAMVGAAVCAKEWGEATARTELLSPAIQEFERALKTCGGRGVVAATLRAVRTLTARVDGLEPVVAVLERALAASDAHRDAGQAGSKES